MFGLVFSLFHVDIIGNGHNIVNPVAGMTGHKATSVIGMNMTKIQPTVSTISAITDRFMPGPPFVFGAFLVMLAMLV